MKDGFRPTLAIVFISVKQDREAVSALFREAGIDMIGATSAGEFIEDHESGGGIVAMLLDLDKSRYRILFQEIGSHTLQSAAQLLMEKAYESFANPAFILLSTYHSEEGTTIDGESLIRSLEEIAGPGLNLFGAFVKLLLVGIMIWGVFHQHVYETRWSLAPGLDLVLHADTLSVLFVALSTVLWLVTTVYAIGYLEHSPHRSRFFGFFSLCVSATVGLALAGNLFTFVVFYELLTLATYPLVAHRGTPEATRGARIHLTYTLGGGMLLLIGTVWLHVLAGPAVFVEGGTLHRLPEQYHPQLKMIFLLLIAGLGGDVVKRGASNVRGGRRQVPPGASPRSTRPMLSGSAMSVVRLSARGRRSWPRSAAAAKSTRRSAESLKNAA